MVVRKLAVAAAIALAAPCAAMAQQVGSVSTIKLQADGERAQTLSLPAGKAAIVELPADARDVLVADPNIVDAVIRSPRKIFLLGLGVGSTSVFFFDREGGEILSLEVSVDRDLHKLENSIRSLLPKVDVKVDALGETVVLTGTAPTSVDALQAGDLAGQYIGSPEKVVNLISVTGREQVLLKVRIVEMDRNLARQLGVNLATAGQFGDMAVSVGTDNAFVLAGTSLGGLGVQFNSLAGVNLGDLTSISGSLDLFEGVGLARTLAEPNLTAVSGESAEFLAGGEFPIPVGTGDEGVAIEFKKFGVGLNFTPVVLGEGRISIKLSTEVSELATEGSFSTGGFFVDPQGNIVQLPGFNVPGVTVRRADTTVELPSGGSLVIAGLLKEDIRQTMQGVPGAKDLPVLGSLFRAHDLETAETELVVIVTPYLVEPTDPDNLQEPGQGFELPGPAESFIFGRMQKGHVLE